MNNPYVSKNQLEVMLSQSEARLGAALALLRAALKDCPENEVKVPEFSKSAPVEDLTIAYDRASDTISARVKPEEIKSFAEFVEAELTK